MNTSELKAEMARHSDTGAILADFLNLTPTSVSLKLNGKRDFTQGEIAKIKERYGLSAQRIDDIFFSRKVS